MSRPQPGTFSMYIVLHNNMRETSFRSLTCFSFVNNITFSIKTALVKKIRTKHKYSSTQFNKRGTAPFRHYIPLENLYFTFTRFSIRYPYPPNRISVCTSMIVKGTVTGDLKLCLCWPLQNALFSSRRSYLKGIFFMLFFIYQIISLGYICF